MNVCGLTRNSAEYEAPNQHWASRMYEGENENYEQLM